MTFRGAAAAVLALGILGNITTAQPRPTVVCFASLIDYQAEFLWTDQSRGVITDFVVPLATFSIDSPESYAGRTVRMIVFDIAHEDILVEFGAKPGERYELELPVDYLTGPDGQYIRSRSVVSIVRSAGQPTD